MKEEVVFFRQFPFVPGQKIHIEDGPRKGDWEVIGVDEKEVTLRCPVSGFTATWRRFCYLTGERQAVWPAGTETDQASPDS